MNLNYFYIEIQLLYGDKNYFYIEENIQMKKRLDYIIKQ